MEIKDWNEYTKEEQESLLMHYWSYYGSEIHTFDEVMKYNDLVKSNPKQIFDFVMFCMANDKNAQSLLVNAMRLGNIDDLIKSLVDCIPEDSEDYLNKSRYSISILVQSYNNPQPSIPFSQEELVKQLSYFFDNKKKDDSK